MHAMIMAGDYPSLLHRGKGIQRDNVVRLVFGGQTALARLLGVTQSTVNHVIFLRRASARIERFVADEVRRARTDLLAAWDVPWAKKNGKKKAA